MSLIYLIIFIAAVFNKSPLGDLGANFSMTWALFAIADALWIGVLKK